MKSIAFGIERVAWPAMRWPLATGAVVVAVLALAAWGIAHLTFDENLRGVFASDTPAFAAYQQATSDFVDPENETMLLVEGDIGRPQTLAKLQDLQLELQFIDGVGSVYSLFALRQAPAEPGAEAPLLVRNTAGGLTPELVARIRAHPLLGAKLLSADGKAMVFVITAAEAKAPLSVARSLKAAIDKTAAEVLAGTELTATVTGFPTLRAAVVDIIRRDQIVLNAVGAAIGFVMSLIAFRSVVAAVMTAVPGMAAGAIVLGVMGLFGLPVTVLSNVIPALVMILGYSDSMHLSHAWRHHRDRGATPAEAELLAQREVAAACMLTSIIVAGAFLSLALTDIGLVRSFALLGTVAMFIGGVVVLVIHALTARLLGPLWAVNRSGAGDLFTAMEGPSGAVAARVVAWARPIALASAVAFIGFGAMYLAVPPEHSIRENLPASDPANAALGRFDAEFGGAFPIEVLVPLNGVAPTSPEGLARIGAIHKAVAAVPGTATPISLWSMVEWMGGAADAATAARLSALLEQADPATVSRLYNQAGTALVTVSTHEEPTRITAAIVNSVEAAATAANGGKLLTVTGVTVLTAREATRTIGTLNASLATAIIGDTILLMLAFRNLPIGFISIIANTLPLFAVGSLLFLIGKGLQLTIVVALTVAFGIAVDDTIHYLNRFLVLGSGRERVGERLIRSSREVGPVLIGSTAIVLTGLSTTLTSAMPTVSLFGIIAAVTLIVAVIGDLIVMPALIAGVARRWFETKGKLAPGEAASEPHS